MPTIRTTPAVRALLISSISAFLIALIADTFLHMRVIETFGVVPTLFFDKYYFWQPFTYMFMHDSLFSILFNMLILWMIGSELEAGWGTKAFLKYYFVCGISAALFYLAIQAFLRGTPAGFMPIVGATGAVYGLLVAYGILFSERQMLFMMVFPMKAKHFVLILAAVEFVTTVFYSQSGVANAAHLGGMVAGFMYLVFRAWLRMRSRKKAAGGTGGGGGTRKKKAYKSHLKLVINNDDLKEFDTSDDEDDQDGKPTVH